METDPRGQLGGLDTTDAVRRKLATESQSFRCSACGKTNQEIIRDCEERAVTAAVPASQIDVDIPADLKMAWKDELTNPTTAQTPNPGTARLPSGTQPDDADKAGVLADGHVETTPAVALAPQDSKEARPVQGLQAPTRGTHSRGSDPPTAISAPAVDPQPPVPLPHRTRNEQGVRRNSDDGVPAWIDRVIVALIIVLAALVLRVLFG
jgi:ubiquitin-conjugating enzyme E2 J1